MSINAEHLLSIKDAYINNRSIDELRDLQKKVYAIIIAIIIAIKNDLNSQQNLQERAKFLKTKRFQKNNTLFQKISVRILISSAKIQVLSKKNT